MNVPGAGRNDIPNRLKRQFAIFHVPPPSEAAINNIFGTLMAGRFDEATFSPEASPVLALWQRNAPHAGSQRAASTDVLPSSRGVASQKHSFGTPARCPCSLQRLLECQFDLRASLAHPPLNCSPDTHLP